MMSEDIEQPENENIIKSKMRNEKMKRNWEEKIIKIKKWEIMEIKYTEK